MFKTGLIIITLLFSIPLSALDFGTQYVQENYERLPDLLRIAIGEQPKEGVTRYTSNELAAGSMVKVSTVRGNRMMHIGFDLFKDTEIASDAREVYSFLENSLLYLALQPSSEILKAAEKRSIVLLLDKNKITSTKNLSIPFAPVIKSSRFSIHCENGRYLCTWELPANKSFSIAFPSDINIITGMDKGELELDLMNRLKSFAAPNASVFEYKGDVQLPNGLHIQTGTAWQDDNFRSDIYLTKKNDTEYLPVFSTKFPVESFSNLFLCNMPITGVRLAITQPLYGNRSEVYTVTLPQLKAFLSQHAQTYFGMQEENATSMKATVIYYNPVFQYVHMVVVETEKATLFSTGEKILQATLYAYIPQHNYIHTITK